MAAKCINLLWARLVFELVFYEVPLRIVIESRTSIMIKCLRHFPYQCREVKQNAEEQTRTNTYSVSTTPDGMIFTGNYIMPHPFIS